MNNGRNIFSQVQYPDKMVLIAFYPKWLINLKVMLADFEFSH